ncbi:VOC family protein [Acetobacteraceae bacterium]|nr:VOC family protein [Candidatus Parcubacteria bacterium]
MKKAPKLIPEFKVTDYEKSLDFYTRLAEFKVHYQRPEEKFAMLEREGAMLMIELLESQDRWAVGERKYPLGQGINFQIEVDNVEKLYSNFKNANYKIFFEMEEKWYRQDNTEVGNRQFLVQDPDGYLLRFFQDLGSRPTQ